MSEPHVDELRETVERMELRLARQAPDAFGAYLRAAARFDVDLADERDRLLARSAALMVVQELAPR